MLFEPLFDIQHVDERYSIGDFSRMLAICDIEQRMRDLVVRAQAVHQEKYPIS